MVFKNFDIVQKRTDVWLTLSALFINGMCCFHLLRRAPAAPSPSVMYTVSDSWVALSECFSCPISHCIVHCMMFLCAFRCYGVVFASLLATKIIWVGIYIYLHISTVYIYICTLICIYTCMCRYIHICICMYKLCLYTHKSLFEKCRFRIQHNKKSHFAKAPMWFFFFFLLMIVHSWMLFVEENVFLFSPLTSRRNDPLNPLESHPLKNLNSLSLISVSSCLRRHRLILEM